MCLSVPKYLLGLLLATGGSYSNVPHALHLYYKSQHNSFVVAWCNTCISMHTPSEHLAEHVNHNNINSVLCTICEQCVALQLVHSDVKDSNILLQGKDYRVVKIADLGISRYMNENSQLTVTNIGATSLV